jgi:hypothetical protein
MLMIGLSKSSAVIPVARQSYRAPAGLRPWVVVRDRKFGNGPARAHSATGSLAGYFCQPMFSGVVVKKRALPSSALP